MDERKKEFVEAVEPLHNWLCKYGNPHMVVIVQPEGAQVFEGIIATPFEVPD